MALENIFLMNETTFSFEFEVDFYTLTVTGTTFLTQFIMVFCHTSVKAIE